MHEKTILVIDDEKDLGETVRMMLEVAGGYKVVTAFNGKDGIKKAHMLKPDLILLDISMPEMDGLTALKILKENSATMAIPVVMLTACGDDVFKLKASQLYDEDYLVKPVKTDELIERVAKVLKRRRAGGR